MLYCAPGDKRCCTERVFGMFFTYIWVVGLIIFSRFSSYNKTFKNPKSYFKKPVSQPGPNMILMYILKHGEIFWENFSWSIISSCTRYLPPPPPQNLNLYDLEKPLISCPISCTYRLLVTPLSVQRL